MKRSVVLILTMLLIIVAILNLRSYIGDYEYTIVLYLIDLISIVICITILLGYKKTESKIAWVIFILSLPVVGIIFYILLGVEYNRFNKFDSNVKFNDTQKFIEFDDEKKIKKILDKLKYK
ncbi:MAG TPA: hypothetical protein GX747_01260, partial [Tenericutes bacterium]|nr:hypothetical protein [Mycoplasmatota bacterium]